MASSRPAVAVLIPAAGQGTRLGGKTRKQFRLLGGEPLLVQTLRAFERHPAVDHLIVAAPAEAVRPLEAELNAHALEKLHAVVPGGTTRQDSVCAALKATPEMVSIILVHDAVRPFISADRITAVIDTVALHGAAALAIPMADTVRQGEHGLFGATVPREYLYRMQTPQGCRRDWFHEAHLFATDHGIQATDDVDLVQRAGYPVHIVPGAAQNVKITTPGDWSQALALWPEWEQARPALTE